MEKIADIIMALLKNANWAEILKILAQTLETLRHMFGAA